MASDYLAVAVFGFLALFVPASMLLSIWLLGPKTKQNPVKLLNYESAEEPIGTHKDITNEYLHYFPLYLGFEFTAIVVIAWASVFSLSLGIINILMMALMGVALLFSAFALLIAKTKEFEG